jgi:hypothetical protein
MKNCERNEINLFFVPIYEKSNNITIKILRNVTVIEHTEKDIHNFSVNFNYIERDIYGRSSVYISTQSINC